MDESKRIKFTLPTEFVAQLHQCVERASERGSEDGNEGEVLGEGGNCLQLFDPDFSSWALGSLDMSRTLRAFLLSNRKNRIEMAMHRTEFLERQCPQFMRLLTDFSHAIECRITPKNLRQLTDSFCIASGMHIVRRYHCDHFRGEAVFDCPAGTRISAERFAEIWLESTLGLRTSTIGL